MLNDIYNKRIIELAGNIPRLGRLAAPDASAMAHSKLCGSTVKIDLKMDGPVVTDFAHDVKACALGQASSSIMASHVVGSTAGELRELRETVRKMLKEKIKALSSEAVASAFIIGCLPPGVSILLTVVNPDYMHPLFFEKTGHLLLMVAAFLMTVGIFSMRKMINFKF